MIVECKHVCRPPMYLMDKAAPDVHYAKILERHDDGTTIPKLVPITDFKRDFWVTNEKHRNHKQKKSWEDNKVLRKYTSTDKDLVKSISRALGSWNYKSMRELKKNPYIYGITVGSTSLVKESINKKLGDDVTAYSSLNLDIETDIDDKSILMLTNANLDYILTNVRRDFLPDGTTVEDIKKAVDKYIGDKIEGIDLRIDIVETESDIIKNGLSDAHNTKPDFLSIWNMDYDINVITERGMMLGIDPKNIFSDPGIPKEERYYKYIEGSRMVVTTEGKSRPRPPSSQWHSVSTPASFYVVDMMCAYRRLIKDGNEMLGGFGLDNILKNEGIGGKLSFKEADGYSGLNWHVFMQKNYPIEYTVYNIWDSLSMAMLEKKLDLLSRLLPTFSGYTDFKDFGSSSKVAITDFHFYLLEKNHVLGTMPIEDTNDPKLLGTRGWILTLPSQNIVDNGLKIIEELPDMRTNIRGHSYDSDAVSAYPRDMLTCNCGKDTTAREVISVEGISKELLMHENLNYSMGEGNIAEYCRTMFNLPSFDEMEQMYIESKK